MSNVGWLLGGWCAAAIVAAGAASSAACAKSDASAGDPAPSSFASASSSPSGSSSSDPGSQPTFAGDAGGGGGASSGEECRRDLATGDITVDQGEACWVNQHVANTTASLEFACAGGAAKAVFGGHTFSGTVNGDHLDLVDVEPFLFNGCDWQSTETISGDLASGAITYGYTEKPVVSCPETPCTAGGTIAVSAGAVTVVK